MASDPDCFRCGHPRTPDNTRIRKGRNGSTYGACRTCDLARKRADWDAKLAAEGKTKRVVDPDCFPCGHPRVPENFAAGRNVCRECNRLWALKRDQRRREAEGRQKKVMDPDWFPCGHPRSEENTTKGRACLTCAIARIRAWDAARDPIAKKVENQDRRLRDLERYREYDRRRGNARKTEETRQRRYQAYLEDLRTPESREYVAILKNDPCAYCGGPADTRDHIVPTLSGGENRWDNYTATCNGCNASKGARSLLNFLLDRRLMLEYREKSA